MKILFLTVEMSPFAKVGGLADVAGSLPQALRALGHDVRVILPAYRMVEKDPQWGLRDQIDSFRVSLNPWWHKKAYLKRGSHLGVDVYLLGTDEWFGEVDRSERLYSPGVDAYLFFARGAIEACRQLDWMPDVVHCHDWHTGFVPAMIRLQSPDFDEAGVVFTIHNLAYQGEFGVDTLDKVGIPREHFTFHEMEAYGCANFLKTGAVFSDLTNTVSERYASEIQTPEYGCRLDGFLSYLASQNRLTGILNGIDPHEWNPAMDLRIPANYDADHPADKAICRSALLKELGMEPIEGAPVVGVVSRLSGQKGMDLMLQAAKAMFAMPVQLVVQGLGDQALADGFRQLEREHPLHCRFVQKFDVNLAQKIYAGSDAFLMPSSFEPCGLGQLIAMRYGTIPVVRETGGLADTVFEGENGFVFRNRDADEMAAALRRMRSAYLDPGQWSRMVDTAMRLDHSWDVSAKKYEQMYLRSLLLRRSEARAS